MSSATIYGMVGEGRLTLPKLGRMSLINTKQFLDAISDEGDEMWD